MNKALGDDRARILVVDDETTNLKAIQQVLQNDYRLQFCTDGKKAIEIAQNELPNLILLDVMMPGLDGYQVCKQLKSNSKTRNIPVIFITVLGDMENEEYGFEVGAVDYINKPIKAPLVKARVKTHLSLVQGEELHQAQLQIVRRLSRAAEFKDDETSKHISRVSHYAEMLAMASGCNEQWTKNILMAAPMHDVGKIGVPDSILGKPGKLDEDEWKAMTQHPAIGASIIGRHDSPMLKMAHNISLQHHEKWDGSGYPKGLKGDAISLEARICAIADVFDALTSERCYKKAWPVEEALNYVQEQSGKHFDPELAALFCQNKDKILAIRTKWADES